MSAVGDRDDLIERINKLEERVKTLETAPRLTSASIREGTLRILDATGNPRVELGKIGTDYGIRIKDSNGSEMFGVRDQGLIQPQLIYPTNRWNDPSNAWTPDVQGSSYDMFFHTQFRKQTPKFSLQFLWYTSDGSTTGRIRVRETITNTVVFESPTLGPSVGGEFLAISQQDLAGPGIGGNYSLAIEARRVSGAGSFRFFVSNPLVSSQ